jgi:DNA-binding transcriptional LysR family regulator
MILASLDLNLLLALDALMMERSVTKAAAKLHMSQPAMSGALARLRAAFDDPLFVRSHGEMRPTARARQLARPISEALANLREAIEPVPAFRFEHSTRTFVLSTSDDVEAVCLGPLITGIRRQAPGVSVRITRPLHAFLLPEDALRSGEADLALLLFPPALRARSEFLPRVLYRDRLVAIVRDRPALPRRLTLQAFLRFPQVRVVYPRDMPPGLVDSTLASIGRHRDAALTVANIASVPAIVARSDLLGVAPLRLVQEWGPAVSFRILELPIPLPDLALTMVWHESRNSDPANAWLRGLIEGTLSPEPSNRPKAPRPRRTLAGTSRRA